MNNQLNLTKKIALLNRITLGAFLSEDSAGIVKSFTNAGIEIMEADFGFAWWKKADEADYELAYKSPNIPYEPNRPRERGGNFEAQKNRLPFFMERVIKENYEKEYDVSPYMKSYVIIPVTYEENIYGSLVLCFKNEKVFSEEERQLAVALGNSAAQSITINRLLIRERRARLEATRQEEYFKALVENSHEIVLLIDRRGYILYASHSVVNICGLEVNDILGHRPREYIFNRDDRAVTKFLRKVIENPRTPHVTEYPFQHKDGRMMTLEVTAYNMLDNPNVKGIVINIRDITEKKNFEAHKETERLLKEEHQRTEFMANAAHEIRTPLAIIRGNVDVALMKGQDKPAKIKKTLRAINSEVEHLSDLISDLTMLANNESVLKEVLAFKEIDLVGVINEMVQRYETVARRKGIVIKVKGTDKVSVMGDRNYLEKLFINLIRNAVNYGKKGGWIKIEYARKKKNVEIAVSDNGIGISAKDLPRIFDRFFRVDKSRNSQNSGIGLGLSIVRWIVTAHAGTISVKSTPSKGTTFLISLPLAKIIK